MENSYLLIIDGAPPHFCEFALGYLAKHNVDVTTLPPNTTSVSQVSDDPTLNGRFAFNRRKFAEKLAELESNAELGSQFHFVSALMDQSYGLLDVLQAFQSRGFEYLKKSSYAQIRVTDASAKVWIDHLRSKGTFAAGSYYDTRYDTKLRSEHLIHYNTLLQNGVIPPSTRGITTAQALNYQNIDPYEGTAFATTRKEKKANARTTAVGKEYNLIDKTDDSTYLLNSEGQINAFREKRMIREGDESARNERKAKRILAKSEIETRNKLLREAMEKTENDWPGYLEGKRNEKISIESYLKGAKPIEWAIARLNGTIRKNKKRINANVDNDQVQAPPKKKKKSQAPTSQVSVTLVTPIAAQGNKRSRTPKIISDL